MEKRQAEVSSTIGIPSPLKIFGIDVVSEACSLEVTSGDSMETIPAIIFETVTFVQTTRLVTNIQTEFSIIFESQTSTEIENTIIPETSYTSTIFFTESTSLAFRLRNNTFVNDYHDDNVASFSTQTNTEIFTDIAPSTTQTITNIETLSQTNTLIFYTTIPSATQYNTVFPTTTVTSITIELFTSPSSTSTSSSTSTVTSQTTIVPSIFIPSVTQSTTRTSTFIDSLTTVTTYLSTSTSTIAQIVTTIITIAQGAPSGNVSYPDIGGINSGAFAISDDAIYPTNNFYAPSTRETFIVTNLGQLYSATNNYYYGDPTVANNKLF
ncbi:hypothetical protein TWF506_005423 [Arthrobotrys conoides]|uniref:Uncharacterized protein n=1 Tax=Arthrobotrys conoides TaxID=74498 RepID=A0AAN8RPV9_9PEZI